MYAVLLVMSVPGPLVAGWLSDRIGRQPVIVGVYLAGAASIALFVLAGDDVLRLWIGIVLLSAFSFVESPQLQALLADVTPRPLRDTAFATYFALAFGVGRWGILYGLLIDLGGSGNGLGLVFWVMAAASVLAAIATLRIRIPPRGQTAADVTPARGGAVVEAGRACAIMPRPSAGTFGRGVAQLGSAHRSGR